MVVRNLWEFGMITQADRTLSLIQNLRVTILTDKTLDEAAIALKYRDILGKKSQQ